MPATGRRRERRSAHTRRASPGRSRRSVPSSSRLPPRPPHATPSTSRSADTVRTRGHLHLVTQVQRELEDIFVGMGYRVMEGPEVEDDWHNFEALNMAPAHPGALDAGHAVRASWASPSRSCCAPTRRRCRSAPWSTCNRRSTWWRPVAPTATRRRRPDTRPCSTRSKRWWSTAASPSPTSSAPSRRSSARCSVTSRSAPASVPTSSRTPSRRPSSR